jgi:hypothetical protein
MTVIKAQVPEPKHPFGLSGRSPDQPLRAAVRNAPGQWAREKRSKRKSSCPFSPCSKFCPWGKSLKLDSSHRS